MRSRSSHPESVCCCGAATAPWSCSCCWSIWPTQLKLAHWTCALLAKPYVDALRMKLPIANCPQSISIIVTIVGQSLPIFLYLTIVTNFSSDLPWRPKFVELDRAYEFSLNLTVQILRQIQSKFQNKICEIFFSTLAVNQMFFNHLTSPIYPCS